MPAVQFVEFGRAATEALASAIVAAKGGRALAPVTVIVPSNLAGLYARRLIGADRGLANVQFVTPFRLAELLSADVLVARRPLTNPVLASAVRQALADDPRPFGEAARHVATTAAVAKMYAQLSHLSPAARDAVAEQRWGRTMVALHDRVRSKLHGYHDEDAVASAAANRDDLDAAVAPFGHLIWHLPERLTHALSGLLRTCIDVASATVIVGVTGDEQADAATRAECERTGVDTSGMADAASIAQPTGSHVMIATDADEEVRSVIRQVWAIAEDGVRLDRIGIVYPARVPYLRTLLAHCDAAGLPANGPSPERLADSMAGQVLTTALDLPASRWRRDRVMALVATGPLRAAGGPVRPAAWERLSREAGIVRGLDDWHHKLRAHADRLRARASDAGHESGSIRRLEFDARESARLAGFVEDLDSSLESIQTATTWRSRSDAAKTMMAQLLGGENQRRWWPVEQQAATDRVTDALERLAVLDDIEPHPSDEAFGQAIDAELAAPAARHHTFGTGVTLVPLAAAAGLDLDAVFLIGMAEDLCPLARREEALLSEAIRAVTAGELETPDEARVTQHRTFLAALGAAPPARRVLSCSRGDLRDGRRRLPSRWLLDTAGALAGRRVLSGTLNDLVHPAVEHQVSHVANLRAWSSAATLTDRDVGAVLVAEEAGVDALRYPSSRDAVRAIECQRARRSTAFTEWDGNLAGRSVPSPATLMPMSPTRLETWATCGFRYFASYVLGLSDREDPEQIIDLSPLERGSALHATLERFVAEAIRQGAPQPDDGWGEAQRQRLHELADVEFDRLEAAGLTGRPLLWRRRRVELHRRLDQFVADDDGQRRERRTIPASAELAFGLDGAEPVSLALDDGRQLRFRGRIDRLDTTEDGAAIVYDYKSGKGSKYEGLKAKKKRDAADVDPVLGGTVLQLGVYAEAARQVLDVAEAEAYFWLLESKVTDKFVGGRWDEVRRRRLLEVVEGIVDGIEVGAFPTVPGEWDSFFQTYAACRHCEFDGLCLVDRGEHVDAKRDAVALHRRPLDWDPEEPGR